MSRRASNIVRPQGLTAISVRARMLRAGGRVAARLRSGEVRDHNTGGVGERPPDQFPGRPRGVVPPKSGRDQRAGRPRWPVCHWTPQHRRSPTSRRRPGRRRRPPTRSSGPRAGAGRARLPAALPTSSRQAAATRLAGPSATRALGRPRRCAGRSARGRAARSSTTWTTPTSPSSCTPAPAARGRPGAVRPRPRAWPGRHGPQAAAWHDRRARCPAASRATAAGERVRPGDRHARRRSADVRRRLDVDRDRPGRARPAAGRGLAPRPPATRWCSWRDAPGRVRRRRRLAGQPFLAEAPLGDLDWEPEKVDAERIRGRGRAVAAYGDARSTTPALRHDATGRLVAWSTSPAQDHRLARLQDITLVDPHHRGHRLGMLPRSRTCGSCSRHEPELRVIDTWNAAVNTAHDRDQRGDGLPRRSTPGSAGRSNL